MNRENTTPLPPPARPPKAVISAVRVLYAAIGLSVLACVLTPFLIPQSDPAIIFLSALCQAAIAIWLIQNMIQGRNLARLIFGIYFVISIPIFLTFEPRLYRDSKLVGLIDFGEWFLHLFAVVNLFSGSAKAWFQPAPTASSASNDDSRSDNP